MAWIEVLLLQENRLILIILALLAVACLLFFILNFHLLCMGRRYRRLMRGVNGTNLEALLQETLRASQTAEKRVAQLDDLCRELTQASSASIQRVGFQRFNAFPDMGSDLSFTLALLNQPGDGVVLCCLVGRDDCRLYAKSVVGGTSLYPLSPEEKDAINKAFDTGN